VTRHALFLALSLALAQSASAQTAPPPVPGEGEARSLDEIVVQAEISYRDRTDDTDPTLIYDLEYFQRFEPDTVGDMLKRVPGAAFVGTDIMEFDDVQLRGLGNGYTQVLINGKKVPGAGDDRTFFVDRIPAEMVDYIEIKRSASANRSGDAVAGAVNIVLRDAYEFDGSYIRFGANRFYDGEVNPTVGAVTSGEFAGGRLLAGVGLQDRYRAKDKRSDRFADPSREELVSFEDQNEVKDGRDHSANLSYTVETGESGRFSLDGFYTRTERDLTEVSFETEFDDEDVITSDVPGFGSWDQENWGAAAEYRFAMAGGETELSLDHARFDNTETNNECVESFENGELVEVSDETENESADDRETGLRIVHLREFGDAMNVQFGVDYREKDRDFILSGREIAVEYDGGEIDDQEDEGVATYSRIGEERVDPFIQFGGESGAFSWEAGLRYERTSTDIDYRVEEYEAGELDDEDGPFRASKDYHELLPSAHLRWDLTEASRISLSLAKTVRRPGFRDITPVTFEGEFEDNDLRDNPDLVQETANGVDLGFEHRLGRKGIVGINLFYREINDLIELVNTGDFSDEYEGQLEDLAEFIEEEGPTQDEIDIYIDEELDAPTFVYQYRNVGKGRVYGAEFDLSTPLTAFGLQETGVFVNYSWLDSRITDFLGRRRFNHQARSVYNVGFIQGLPTWNASFGASYRKQGDAFSRILTEEVLIRYGGDLEMFIEKNFGRNLSLRLTASNLLDASKDEFFNKFDDQADQIDRDFDEYEVEREEAGPRYQLVLRWAF
jgi:TonB-dependent receptor